MTKYLYMLLQGMVSSLHLLPLLRAQGAFIFGSAKNQLSRHYRECDRFSSADSIGQVCEP